jgi:NADPH:quinone reductase-like Zn-dependent oxidoreductase
MAAAEAEAQYSAIVPGATGNVGGRIVQLLIKNSLYKKVVVVTRRETDAFADPKVSEAVVNRPSSRQREPGRWRSASGTGDRPDPVLEERQGGND